MRVVLLFLAFYCEGKELSFFKKNKKETSSNGQFVAIILVVMKEHLVF